MAYIVNGRRIPDAGEQYVHNYAEKVRQLSRGSVSTGVGGPRTGEVAGWTNGTGPSAGAGYIPPGPDVPRSKEEREKRLAELAAAQAERDARRSRVEHVPGESVTIGGVKYSNATGTYAKTDLGKAYFMEKAKTDARRDAAKVDIDKFETEAMRKATTLFTPADRISDDRDLMEPSVTPSATPAFGPHDEPSEEGISYGVLGDMETFSGRATPTPARAANSLDAVLEEYSIPGEVAERYGQGMASAVRRAGPGPTFQQATAGASLAGSEGITNPRFKDRRAQRPSARGAANSRPFNYFFATPEAGASAPVLQTRTWQTLGMR